MSPLRAVLSRAWHSKCHIYSQKKTLFSESGKWHTSFDEKVRHELEIFWKPKIKEHPGNHAQRHKTQSKYYVLSMFPYPSGKLHMGHVRVYAISDAMARYSRLMGKYVIHPMGWDAFGLPAENAAIERGIPPDEWTSSNINTMREQLEDLCCSFDWERELSTCDSEYYRWTQNIFLQMYKDGLVYHKEAFVNWDPVDKTVLADEQIDEQGRSWRSGALAEKKLLKQWYIKTTAYSQSLFDGLAEVDRELWKDIIELQKNWIGECNGLRLQFKIKIDNEELDSISVHTKNPEGIYGASHILLSSTHPLNKSIYYEKNEVSLSEDIPLRVMAYQPLTEQLIPIYVSVNEDFGENLDAHLGIPSCDDKDKKFAVDNRLTWVGIMDPDGKLKASKQFTGLTKDEAFQKIAREAQKMKCGGEVTSEKARDWLISRQRYWGTPIPLIHCPKYGTMPVPLEDLPVELPKLTNFKGEGQSPLAHADDWLHVKCPRCDCDGYATRETDTMDTFVDSSWYYLRYLDRDNKNSPVNPELAKRYLPVDLYIGGKEHAIMHLYYARFVSHYLQDLGLVAHREPFKNLLTQGMVMGQSYKIKESGRYIPPDQVTISGKGTFERETSEEVVTQWEKMSKSKYNGVDPQSILGEYGSDATRLCILSNVAPKSDRHWNPDAFVGVHRWQCRMWSLVTQFLQHDSINKMSQAEIQEWEDKIFESRNYFLKEVSYHLGKSFLLNVAISRLQGLTNFLKKCPHEALYNTSQGGRALCEMVIMISPFAPLFASELWTGISSSPHRPPGFNWDFGVLDQAWPAVDEHYTLSMKVKINGKDAYEVGLPMSIKNTTEETMSKAMALKLAEQHPDYDRILKQSMITTHVFTFIPQVRAELNYIVKKTKKKSNKKS